MCMNSSSQYKHLNGSLAICSQQCRAIALPTNCADEVRPRVLFSILHIGGAKLMACHWVGDFLQAQISMIKCFTSNYNWFSLILSDC